MLRYITCLFLLVLSTSLFGEQPHPLTFEQLFLKHDQLKPGMTSDSLPPELIKLNGKEIKIRGFLYQTPDKNWILAPQPDLKNCCVGVKDKITQQIYLKSNAIVLNDSNNASTFKGKFFIEPVWNDHQELSQLYLLNEPLLIEHQSSRWLGYSAIIIAITLCLTLIASICLKNRADADSEE